MRSLAILAALLLAPTVANAQAARTIQDGRVVPPDVDPWVEVVPEFAAGTTPNTKRDPVADPATETGIAALDNDFSETGWIAIRGTPRDENVVADGFCLATIPACGEAKARFHANMTKVLYDDPIRNWGQPGTSHCHMFFGNYHANAYSTYASLRERNRSFATGGPMNATAYWFPCLQQANAFGDGKDYAVKVSNSVSIYYQMETVDAQESDYIPDGLRYVFGWDMDDPDRTWLQDYIDDANAQPGTSPTRYKISSTGNWRDHNPAVWSCDGVTSKYLANYDGTDVWGSACAAGETFYMEIAAPSCWDGVNLWSPGGYRHLIYGVYDTVAGHMVCPQNYIHIPRLILKIFFYQGGEADRLQMRLSSDDMAATVLGSPVRNGESFHTDWMDGWKQDVKRTWMDECLGVRFQTPRTCNDSVISATESLIVSSASPSGLPDHPVRSPQVDHTTIYSTASPTTMVLLPENPTDAVTVDIHH